MTISWGLWDSRGHVYGVIERYKSPYVSAVCGGKILGLMCIGEGGLLGLFVGSWRMRNLWLYICSGGDPSVNG